MDLCIANNMGNGPKYRNVPTAVETCYRKSIIQMNNFGGYQVSRNPGL